MSAADRIDTAAGSPANTLGPVQRFWRSRRFARIRHRLLWLRRTSPLLTRAHAKIIKLSGGRIQRSFLFTVGLPLLVVTTVGRRTGERRSTPLGYIRSGDAFAVIASNAGSDRVPAWWLNLQADPHAEILVNRTHDHVIARPATPSEEEAMWAEFAHLNPGYDEYRNLTDRRIPVVMLELEHPPSLTHVEP
jgi:deazaflavin-dependent oxidoreductase (nitroreductase family)